MKNKRSYLITLLGTIGVISLSAGAAGSQYNVADSNIDGMVSPEEVVTYVQMNYLKIDKNTFNIKETAELEAIFDIDG